MINEELDRRLLQIVKEQQSASPRDITSGSKRLLSTLRESVSLSIDAFYILSEGSEGKELFVDDGLGNPTAIYVEPHIFEYDGRELHPTLGHSLDEVISGRTSDLKPQNFALIVDDCWERGTTVKKTVKYLEHLGYEREKIFVFHYFGSGSMTGFKSERYGFTFQNPVLVSAATMIDFFDHPWKYR